MQSFARKILLNAFKLFDLLTMGVSLILSVHVVSNSISWPALSQIGQIEIKILNLIYFILALFTVPDGSRDSQRRSPMCSKQLQLEPS